jgi:amino acid adenylation domain-containing protein
MLCFLSILFSLFKLILCRPPQVEEERGCLLYGLDFLQGKFPEEVMAGIAGTYHSLLEALAADATLWKCKAAELLPPAQQVVPVAEPRDTSQDCLHEGFLRRAAEAPDAVAVMGFGKQRLTYGEVEHASRAVAQELERLTVGRATPKVVAVVMRKGWEQVVAVLGCHRARCAYLPVDAGLPQQRVEQLLELSGACAVVCQGSVAQELDWLAAVAPSLVLVDDATLTSEVMPGDMWDGGRNEEWDADSLAYLIYTSGSTGVPKGVCCHHRGAVNTLEDLNERFSVGPEDRVLALSSLSFDLSVYDVFGVLMSGGGLVVPSPDQVSPPDPEAWLRLVESEHVSVWNTVPAFMELLCDYAEHAQRRLPRCLRVVWMSGDWIPQSLPGRIRALSECEDLKIISMGGATEAAIWSNMHEIEGDGVLEGWSSIPYGRPLRNQSMLVLDEGMRHCEAWVTGMLYIGGVGVASGYFRDEERTAKQFVVHPHTGEYLFRTGDLARLRPDGNLEILGREDSQVKVNGFRVELGEIEACLAGQVAVADACVVVNGPRGGHQSIMAFVTPAPHSAVQSDEAWPHLSPAPSPCIAPPISTRLTPRSSACP